MPLLAPLIAPPSPAFRDAVGGLGEAHHDLLERITARWRSVQVLAYRGLWQDGTSYSAGDAVGVLRVALGGHVPLDCSNGPASTPKEGSWQLWRGAQTRALGSGDGKGPYEMTNPVDPVAAANLAGWLNTQPVETGADSARQIGRSFYVTPAPSLHVPRPKPTTTSGGVRPWRCSMEPWCRLEATILLAEPCNERHGVPH